MPRKCTKDEFIKKARLIHGEKYDYSKADYVNNHTKVCIVCPKHGEFWQVPNSHLNGHGCPKCANSGVKLTQEEFISKMNEINPNIDFENFNYVNAHTKGICKCKICGFEWKNDYSSLRNLLIGCPMCSIKSRTDKRKDSLEEFVTKLKNKYPSIDYDFSESVYTNSLTKIDVICKKHGHFKIRPNDLMNGCGCPRCNESHLEKQVSELLNHKEIEFEQGKGHEWLFNEETNRCLTLDFYLPKHNMAIECQGIQHFKPIRHFGGKKGFEERIVRDKLKKKLCLEHGVKLVYFLDIVYNDFLDEDDLFFNDITELNEYLKKQVYNEKQD